MLNLGYLILTLISSCLRLAISISDLKSSSSLARAYETRFGVMDMSRAMSNAELMNIPAINKQT